MTALATLILSATLYTGPGFVDEPDAASQTVVNLLIKQLKDREPKKRAEAAKEPGELGAKAKSASRQLAEACMDGNGKVSVAAIDAMEKVRPELHKHVVTIVTDADHNKHIRAFSALAELRDEANAVAPLLLAYLSRGVSARHGESSECIACVSCIGAIAGEDPTILSPLNGISRRYPGTRLTGECLNVLSRLGEAKPELRKKVYPTLMASLSSTCKKQGINGLARLGADATDALPALKKLRFDKDEDVRNAANAAIEQIEQAAKR